MIEMRLKDGTVFQLSDTGEVIARSDGPKGWNYSGKWKIVGFKKRHHSLHTISLESALAGTDVGQGWVVDLDHGTYRLWGSPKNRKLASLRRV